LGYRIISVLKIRPLTLLETFAGFFKEIRLLLYSTNQIGNLLL
jgi:hypothetical protein